MGVVRAVVLSLLRFLLLHHLAAHLSSPGAGPESETRRAARRNADALRRFRQPVLRMARAANVGVDRQRSPHTTRSRLYRLWRRVGHAAVVHVDSRSGLGDGG